MYVVWDSETKVNQKEEMKKVKCVLLVTMDVITEGSV